MAAELQEEVEEKIIHEEYKVWKKNVPFLYDVVLTHALDWPSLTCQWLPVRNSVKGGDYAEHKLVLGTHTNGDEDNYLMIATVRLPTEDVTLDASKYDEEKGELGSYGGSTAKIDVSIRITHEREVNRARYCPQNSFLIATKSPSADVLVFDWSKHPSKPVDSVVRPWLRLKGHEKEGYGLSWSTFDQGRIVSSGDDKLVCMWDTAAATPATTGSAGAGAGNSGSGGSTGATVLQASRKFTGHTAVVEDVAWHRHTPHLFGSCGDDKHVIMWDVRDASTGEVSRFQAHDGDVMSLSFNPYQEHYLLTSGTDKLVRLWDLRNTRVAVHDFVAHNDDVTGVAWSPFNETVFASNGADRRLFLWDTSRIGAEQSEEDAEDGPPELLFVHGGHTAKISDFSWCETEDWFLASVAEDNVLHVWQPSEEIIDGGGDEDEEEGEGGDGGATATSKKAGVGGAGAGVAPAPPAKRSRKSAPADEDLE